MLAFWFPLGLALMLGAHAAAQTNEELPKLLPPYQELPPTFWEQHGTLIILAGIVGVILIAIAVWLRFRSQPVPSVPPAVVARQGLETLRDRPEDGALLSRVSQILRGYFMAAFQVPKGELTTSEFCKAISGREPIGPELSTALTDFLHRCDERKFAPTPPATPLSAVDRALQLLAMGEARRAPPHPADPAQPPPGPPARA